MTLEQDLSNVFSDTQEIHSYTLGAFVATSRETFSFLQLNITLLVTDNSQYYTSPSFKDPNCNISQIVAYKYLFETFSDTSLDIFKFKYVYAEYENTLCPLSTYKTSLQAFDSSANPLGLPENDSFTTGKI